MEQFKDIIKDKINEQNEDYIEELNEKKIENSDIYSINILNRYIKQFQKSVCKIKINNSFGTGILIQLQKGNDLIYGLITCEHVIEQKLINSKTSIDINYNYINNNCKSVTIILDEKERFIRNYRYLNLDITVVQIYLSEIEKEFFLKTNFLEEAQKNFLKNKRIYIFQFPMGLNDLSFSSGDFHSIETSYRFRHLATTQKGSSGGPIFIFIEGQSYLIGIHKGGNDEQNIGDFIHPVINSLKEDAYYIRGKEVIEGTFEGEYLPGNKQKGILIKSKEEKYIGELAHFIPNGLGTLIKNKHILYQGKFSKGNYEGEGKLFNEDGSFYEGQFVNNKKHGKGTLYDSNQNIKYSGNFVEDNYEGEGQLFYENGNCYEGQFVNNKRHGKGILFDKNKKIIFEGDFSNDTYEKNNKVGNCGRTCILKDEKALDDLGNEILSMIQPIGTQLNVSYKCDNCECSTDDHHYDSENKCWHCNNCGEDCYNRPSTFVKSIMNLFN